MKYELSEEQLKDIETKAETCEPKIWISRDGNIIAVNFDDKGSELLIADVEFREDADFIAAANPKMVLSIISELRRLQNYCSNCGGKIEIFDQSEKRGRQ